jgi:hypothetical protein
MATKPTMGRPRKPDGEKMGASVNMRLHAETAE